MARNNGRGRNGRGRDRGRNRGNKRGKLYRRAERDVMLGLQPQLDEISRAMEEARADSEQMTNRVNAGYDAFAREVAPLSKNYQNVNTQIGNDLASQVGMLGGMLGEGATSAAQAFMGAGAGSDLGLLGSNAQRDLGWNTSMLRQGEIERLTTSRNNQQDLRDTLQDMRQQKVDLMDLSRSAILSRLSELRDTQFEHGLASSELDLRRAAVAMQNASTKAQQDLIATMIENWLAAQKPRRDRGRPRDRDGRGSNPGPSGHGRRS